MDSDSNTKMFKQFSIRPRLATSLLLAGLVAIFLPHGFDWATRLLCIWDVVMICFLALTWRLMIHATPAMMRRSTLQAGEELWTIFGLITIATCVNAIAVGHIPDMKETLNIDSILSLGIGILTIIGSWLLLHTIFAEHYADVYYQGDKTFPERKLTGLDFPGEIEPDYGDFLYFSFVIGMTSQVSDVDVTSHQMRHLSLVQGILSFFFNTTILAIAINIIAGII